MIPPARKAVSHGSLPQRREGVRCHPIDDEAVLYDVALDTVHYLNATARFIWDRCDGRHTVEEIGAEMAGAFEPHDAEPAETAPDALIADVRKTLENLSAHGLLDHPARLTP